MKKLYTVRQIYEKLQGEGSKFEMKLLYPVKINKSWDLMESKCQASHRHTIRFCESQELMYSKCQPIASWRSPSKPPSMPNLHFSIPAIYKSIPHFETAML
jgi:hypothetical protein